MSFRPNSNDELTINDTIYRIVEHPAAPGMPYGQTGRAGTVYKLTSPEGDYALKVFQPRFRVPALVSLTERLAPYAALPGLQVCNRVVLTPQRHNTLLRQFPDLLYAVHMPWIAGPTWMEVLMERRALLPKQSLALARAFAEILMTMEQESLAHCDLSGPNVLLPGLLPESGNGWAALVDVEQLYSPDLWKPEALPGGSAGYAHKTAPQGLWSANADRFAGAVLLGEMLGWCDEKVRNAAEADSETYFDPQELQQECTHFQTLHASLCNLWGDAVGQLLERAWRSDTLSECPTFGEWMLALPETVPQLPELPAEPQQGPVYIHDQHETVRVLLALAGRLEALGQHLAAAETYREALALSSEDGGLSLEIAHMLKRAESRLRESSSAPDPTPANSQQPVTTPKPLPQPGPPTATTVWQEQAYLITHRKSGLAGLLNWLELTAFTFSPDGKQLISALNDRSMVLWDLADWANADVLQRSDIATSDSIVAISWHSADHHAIQYVTLSKYWLELHSLDYPDALMTFSEEENIADLKLSPTRRLLTVTTGETTSIYRYDGTLLHRLPVEEPVYRLAISPDGNLLAIETTNAVGIWRVEEGTLIVKLFTDWRVISAMAFSPAGRVLAIGDETGAIDLWDIATGVKKASLSKHQARILGLVFSPKDDLLASTCEEMQLYLWRASDGTMVRQIQQDKPCTLGLAFSPDGQWLASASRDGDIALWRQVIK